MTAITLRNIPPKLQEAIRQRAGKDGLSLNKAVLRLLEEAVGERTSSSRELHHDLDHLAGTWSDQEAADFDAALIEQRRVDPELWGRAGSSTPPPTPGYDYRALRTRKASQENPGGVAA